MTKLKLTKSGLREEEVKLNQLQIYLPTLQLKKSMLQAEVNTTINEILKKNKEFSKAKEILEKFKKIITLTDNGDILKYLRVKHVVKTYENIAGVEIPKFEHVEFEREFYFLLNTPFWMDSAVDKFKKTILIKEFLNVLEEKKRALKKELKDVSIRVNLFEKILIPRTFINLKKIKIFLSDQALAAVSQAKVAKGKILAKKKIV